MKKTIINFSVKTIDVLAKAIAMIISIVVLPPVILFGRLLNIDFEKTIHFGVVVEAFLVLIVALPFKFLFHPFVTTKMLWNVVKNFFKKVLDKIKKDFNCFKKKPEPVNEKITWEELMELVKKYEEEHPPQKPTSNIFAIDFDEEDLYECPF